MRGRTSPQIALANAPADGVTCVRFASNDTVVASSWDSHVYLYDAVGNTLRARYAHRAAVLDVAPISATSVLSGGVDRELRSHDWVTGTETVLGVHDAPIRCIEPLPGATSFVSGSWDRSVKLWDVRAPSACQGTFVQPDKVFALATAELSSAPIVVVATAGRAVLILDARNMAEPLQRRESSLKTQTRCVACHIDGGGYALGSVEGRVAMEYIDASPEVQARKYAFKCHRSTSEDGMDVAHPVNALAFHPVHGTFASGGCDGTVNAWDGAHKKRLCQWSGYPAAIASLGFSPDGRRLAVASSYTFEEGNRPHAQDAIFVRELLADEFAPKSATIKQHSSS